MLSNAAPMPSPDRTSLRRRVLVAGGWSLTSHGLSQALRFGSNLLMTRLLVPETFGVMAIAGLVMVGLAMFSDVGLKQSVVQSRRNDPAFLNTAWVIQILRGVFLWFLALCLAFFVLLADRTNLIPKNTVYADPNLPYVIAVLSLTAVIGGFQSTKLFEASRSLSLAEVTKIEIAAQIAGLLCMIGWVSIDRSVWPLVAGSVCSTLVATFLSHTRLPGVANRWQWDKSAAREIVHFGKWIFLSSILGFLVINGDRLLLGGLVNTTVLGIYVIAFLIFNAVDQLLTKIITDVSFPALSEIARERPLYLRAGHYRFQAVIASFAYFCAGILMTSGQTLIELLYDERYQQAGWMVEVLAVALLTIPFRTVTQCFMALGLPHILSNIIAFRLATLFVATPMGFHFFGLPGALWGIVLSHFSYLPILIVYSAKKSLFDLRKELLLLPTVVMGMTVGMLFVVAIGHWR